MNYFTHNIQDFNDILQNKNNDILQEKFSYLKQYIKNIPVIMDITKAHNLEDLQKFVNSRGDFKHLILLGTGGSALGAYAVSDWLGHFNKQKFNSKIANFHILDNFDPISHKDFFADLPINDCQFLIISKSGGTLETLSQAYMLADIFKQNRAEDIMHKHICVITENKNSALTRYALKYNLPSFEHDDTIGGRYSVMTMTGILPALFLGYDVNALRNSAKKAVDDFTTTENYQDSELFLSSVILSHYANLSPLQYHNHIAVGYGDNFRGLILWMRQLIAESLGKQSKGLLFVPSFGPVDQHSQLQLYSAGTDDKIYTIFAYNSNQSATIINTDDAGFDYINQKTNIDVKNALQNGTIASLRNVGRKIREIHIDEFSIETLGYMMMWFMLETIICADLTDVDAFNQPEVEDSKVRAKAILKSL